MLILFVLFFFFIIAGHLYQAPNKSNKYEVNTEYRN